MGDYGETAPFWPRPTVVRVRGRGSSCLARLLSLPIVPVVVIVALFFVVPPFLSVVGTVKVKPSWDSFSVLLVLFAVLSGVFAKRNDGVLGDARPQPAAPVARPWFDEGVSRRVTGGSGSGLRRSGGSHSDLRRESPDCDDDRFRWFDDFEINRRSSSPEFGGFSRRARIGIGENFDDVKVIPVDTCVLRSSPPPPSPPPPPDPPEKSVPTPHSPPERNRSLEKTVIVSRSDAEIEKISSPETASLKNPAKLRQNEAESPPHAAAEVVPRAEGSGQKQGKFERRKSIAIKEITMVLQLASVYNQRKRIDKKPKVKSNSDSPPEGANRSAMLPPPSPAPPPPPLPPPPSAFHSLIKKGLSKNNWKKIKSLTTTSPPHSSTLGTQTQISPPPPPPEEPHLFTTLPPPSPAPPPPPLPPPPSIFHNLVKKGLNKKNWKKIKSLSLTTPPLSSTQRTETQISPPPEPAAPPVPPRRRKSSAAGKPPLVPVPAAALQCRATDAKLVLTRDIVRVKSTQSHLRSEAVDQVLASDGSSGSDGRDAVGSVCCASPDVNVKADTFIARLKDGWRLEKMNSVREKKDVGLDP